MANLATGSSAALPHGAQAGVVLSATVDFAANPLTATNAHNILNIPAGTYVAKVTARVLSADTGTSTRTFDVGDGVDPDGFIDGADAKTVGFNVMTPALTEGTPNTLIGFGVAGKVYATADTIDITAGQDLVDAVVEVRALCFAL